MTVEQSMFTKQSLNLRGERKVNSMTGEPDILPQQRRTANFNAFGGRAPRLFGKIQSVLTSTIVGLVRFSQIFSRECV